MNSPMCKLKVLVLIFVQFIYSIVIFGQCPQGQTDNDADGYCSGIDCNDNNSAIHPGVSELCNGIDDNCNSQIDEGLSSVNPANTIAYWRFEEGVAGIGAGATILDNSLNNLNGIPVNAPLYSNNLPVNTVPQNNLSNQLSLDFNGGNQKIFVNDNALLALTQSLTLEAFVFPKTTSNGLNGQIIFRGDDRGALDPYYLCVQNNYFVFQISDAGGNPAYVFAPLPGINQWIHVAGTLDDATGEMKLFINGNLANSTITSIRPFGLLNNNFTPGIGVGGLQGALNLSQGFNGLIDEVRISNVALTQDKFLISPEAITYYLDYDNDGFGGDSSIQSLCSPLAGFVTNHSDCADSNAFVHPGASEICGNETDDNCDGIIDDGCPAVLNLKLFIQGFYISPGAMIATVDPLNYPALCDTILIELHESFYPYAKAAETKSLLETNGTSVAEFPSGIRNHTYFIIVKHRNSLETWSKTPLMFNRSVISLDLTHE